MAEIYPFRALRYNQGLVRIGDVVTQPYDKITPAMQTDYYARSPYNLVRIILGRPEPGDGEADNVYTRAADYFRRWRTEGVLAGEAEPAVFAYSQRFTVPGSDPAREVERRGFIALGRLHEYADGVVFRHEQTLARPRSDRLRLLQATRAHFGQIFMLYSDPARTVDAVLFGEGGTGRAPAGGSTLPDMEAVDEYGVLHRVWRVDDPHTINLLCGTLGEKRLIIADGHHRYETALAYARERAPEALRSGAHPQRPSGLPMPPAPEAAAMMTFVNMDSEGLVILPTHRVVHGLPAFRTEAFLRGAEALFTATRLETAEPAEMLRHLDADGRHDTAFVAVTRDGAWLLLARAAAVAALARRPEREAALDVVRLHALLLEGVLGLSAESIRDQTNLRYLRSAEEAVGMVRDGGAQIAFLMNPVTVEQMREVAFAGEVMPQKSTDFYPKLLSGLTIYALDE